MRSAVVLAGGYSRRFGSRDKALAEVDGEALVRRVTERVAPAVDEVIVNCRAEQRDPIATALSGIDHHMALDPSPDEGPVAGIRTGCRATGATWTFVTACDMPLVSAPLAAELFDAAAADGAVPLIDGRPRPLAAVYRSSAAVEAADATLDADSGAVMAFLERLSMATVPEPVPARAVTDVDTRADLRELREKLDQWPARTENETSEQAPERSFAVDSN